MEQIIHLGLNGWPALAVLVLAVIGGLVLAVPVLAVAGIGVACLIGGLRAMGRGVALAAVALRGWITRRRAAAPAARDALRML